MWNNKPINIKTAIKPLGGCQDQPWLMEDDDKKQYVVKFRRNDNIPTIMNEIFANKLAVQLNLPVPKMFLVNVDEQLINKVPELTQRKIKGGRHIATEFIKNSITMNDLLGFPTQNRNILNMDQVPKFVIFDMMLYNNDRHNKNILLAKNYDGNYKYYLIDHGTIFCGKFWGKSIYNLRYKKIRNNWQTNGSNYIDAYQDFAETVNDLKKSDYWNSANYIIDEFLLHSQTPKFIVNKLVQDNQKTILNFINDSIKSR